MRAYTARRHAKVVNDPACPDGVLAVYDNGGQTPNRYTILYRHPLRGRTWQDRFYGFRSCGEDPFDPVTGPGAPREMLVGIMREFRINNRHHAISWSDLPLAVQQVCRIDLDL